jgi:hypothetical protein
MTDSNPANDECDVAKIFSESDDIGSRSSLWFRPLRQLLEDGKPPSEVTVLTFRDMQTGAYPFGVLAHTKNNRIIFWPVLAKNADMVAGVGKEGVIDHITLELPSEKFHVTAYDATGEPSHCEAADFGHRQAWRLQRFEDSGVALWFTLSVKWSTLVDQETAVQRLAKAPNAADAKRREQIFRQYAAKIKIVDIPLPTGVTAPEYVYCNVFYVTEPEEEIKLTPNIFLLGDINAVVDGWTDGTFEIQSKRLLCEQTQFLIATACPPGTVRREVFLGFPRQVCGPGIQRE